MPSTSLTIRVEILLSRPKSNSYGYEDISVTTHKQVAEGSYLRRHEVEGLDGAQTEGWVSCLLGGTPNGEYVRHKVRDGDTYMAIYP